ncbi:MAG: penicillin-binding protein 2 [bacterium]
MWQGSDLFEQKRFERRLKLLVFLFVFCLSVVLIRLFVLQIVKGQYYTNISERNRTQLFFQRGPRGIIYDRYKVPVVDNIPKVVVLFSPLNLSKELLQKVIFRLSGILGMTQESIWDIVSKKKKESAVLSIAEDISRQALFKLEELKLHLPGVSLAIEPKRRYSTGNLASHIIGYIGGISKLELSNRIQDGYRMRDIVGKLGVEKVYDSFLRGRDGGFQLEVDAVGMSKRILYQIPSKQGNNIYLCIDKDVQSALENAFSKRNYEGAGVVISPEDGSILALCSFPNFDPNAFIDTKADVSSIVYDKETKPLFNRALQGQYPPGSVFKIITSIAMLEKEGFDPESKVRCKGTFHLGGKSGRTFRCWKEKGHGSVDFMQGFAESCDVYFYTKALETGVDAIVEVASDFNLGRIIGIDIPGESGGLLPNPYWKKRVMHEPWYTGDTVNMSIGQGFLTVSPLQAAILAATVANRGMLWRPYIVDRIVDSDGSVLYKNEPYLVSKNRYLDGTWELLDAALKEVVESGTGMACKIKSIEVAGKTGTAQNPHGEDHAWFVAYASLPGEKPEIALSILVVHGEHGASAAAPIAREVIQAYFKAKEERSEKASDLLN